MTKNKRHLLSAAALAGTVNGLFGGGGGMILLPLLNKEKSLQGHALFANSIAVMLPLSLVNLCVTALAEPLPLAEALPYLAGGAAGALLGSRFFGRVPTAVLRRLFAAFLLYAGVKYLL